MANFLEIEKVKKKQQGVAEGKWFRTAYGWAGGAKPGGGTYKHPETAAAERRAKLAAKKKAEHEAKFGKSDGEPGVAEGNDYFARRKKEDDAYYGIVQRHPDGTPIKPRQQKTTDYQKRRNKERKQDMAEGTIPEDMFRTKAEVENPVDSVKLDIPLLIRIMEYAREDAKTDLDLHDIAERLISIGRSGNTLSMRDYDRIVGKEARPMLTNKQ